MDYFVYGVIVLWILVVLYACYGPTTESHGTLFSLKASINHRIIKNLKIGDVVTVDVMRDRQWKPHYFYKVFKGGKEFCEISEHTRLTHRLKEIRIGSDLNDRIFRITNVLENLSDEWCYAKTENGYISVNKGKFLEYIKSQYPSFEYTSCAQFDMISISYKDAITLK